MLVLARKKEFLLNAEEWAAVKASGFTAARSTHADRLACIKRVWDQYGFLVDPHTADGINAAMKERIPGVKTICLETALPAKFASTIKEAVGFEPPVPAGYEGLLDKPQKVLEMPADAQLVKNFLAEHDVGK